MMKRLNITLLVLSTLVAAIGCNRSEDAYITPSDKSIELTSDANDITFTVSSNVKWTMSVSDKWFKITPKVGDGETEIRLVAERNTTGLDRSSVLEFTDGTIVERVEVTQSAFIVNMGVECPESVEVKKGESLAIELTEPADDWEYTLTDGSWLKEFSKTDSRLIFQLDPSVAFDENVPAVIEFTSPSDPTFYAKAAIKPVNWFKFSATVPESIDLGVRGSQLRIDVDANFDWTYSVKNGSWLQEYDKTGNVLVFDGKLANLLNENVPAEITFTSQDYANFNYVASVLPVAPITTRLVDKAGLKPIVLTGDSQWVAGTEQYLFDGAWTIYKGKYNTFKNGNPDAPTGISYKSFSFSMNGYKIQNRPMTFTIDAGERINLAKFVTYHYYQFEGQTPLTYDIYAYKTNGTPTGAEPLGSELFEGEDGWVKIGSVNNVGKITDFDAKYKDGDYFDELAQGDIISIDEDNTFPARYYRFAMTGNGYWWYAVKADETGISRNKQSWGIPWDWLGWCTLSEISLYEYIDY
jgi:hypothetical protein